MSSEKSEYRIWDPQRLKPTLSLPKNKIPVTFNHPESLPVKRLSVLSAQVSGHYAAKLDPLELDDRAQPIELDPALYGFSEADLDREFFLGTWRMKGFLSEDRPRQTLRDILNRLQ